MKNRFDKHLLLFYLLIPLCVSAQSFTGLAPLKVGNSWTYVENYFGDNPKYEIYTVLDSGVFIGPNEYYKIEYKTEYYIGSVYMGKNSNYYYRYSEEFADSIYLYLKRPLRKDDVWEQYFNLPNSIKLTSVVSDSMNSMVFGKSSTVYEIIRETILIGSGEYWTKEFGRLYSIEEFAAFSLVGCFIDGVVYGDTTLVGVKNEESIPNEVTLSQNYPNPFNPSTTIKFTVPNGGTTHELSLRVYDILGREIKTLLNKPMQPGTHKIEFDGSNLTSGVYFYVLETGGKRLSKKMMLIK